MRTRSVLCHIILLVGVGVIIAFIGADIAHAQGKFVPLAPDVGKERISRIYDSRSLSDFMNKLFTAAIALGAILAVLRLSFAGYLYMTTDAWGQKGKAKEVIGDVILGLLLLLSIWLILRQINPNLLNLDALNNIYKLPATQQTPQQTGPVGSSPVPGFSPTGIPNNPLDSLAQPTP